jgi:hypothetical protein
MIDSKHIYFSFSILIFVLICCSLVSAVFAQTTDTLTVVTYFPLSSATYQDLDAQRVAVNFQHPPGPIGLLDNFLNVNTLYSDTIGIGGDAASPSVEIRIRAPAVRNRLAIWNINGSRLVNLHANNIPGCELKTVGEGCSSGMRPMLPANIYPYGGLPTRYLCCASSN